MTILNRRAPLLLLCLLVLVALPRVAKADCTSPSATESTTKYDYTAHALIVCTGTSWISLSGGASGTAGYVQFSNGSGGFTSDSTSGGQLYWDSTNHRLGIGTTTPSNILSFGGEAARTIGMERTSAGTNGFGLTISAGGAKSATADLNGGDLTLSSGTATGTGSSNIYLKSAAAQGSSASTDNASATRMTILGNGNIGIGTNSPMQLLHVHGANSNLTSAAGNVFVTTSAANGADVGGSMSMGGLYSTGVSTPTQFVGLVGRKENATDGNYAGYFALFTRPAGSAIAERMRVTSAGNVGIGTTSPTAVLDVWSASNVLQLGRSSVGAWTASLTNNVYGPGADTGDLVWAPTGAQGASNSGFLISSVGSVQHAFFTNGNAYHAGNVGIGTTTPSYPLSLGGDAARTIGMERTSAGTNGYGLTISAGGAKSATTDLNGGDLTLASGTTTGAGSSNIYFKTATAAATGSTDNAPTTKLTILGNGNIGIGTTSPGAPLEIGTNRPVTLNGATGAVNIKASGGGWSNGYYFTGSSNTAFGGYSAAGAADAIAYFFIGPSYTAPIIDFYPTGNVGIGTLSPGYMLTLNGEATRTIGMERTTAGTNGYGLTIAAGSAKISTADLNGGDLTLSSGTATGTGSSNINFQTVSPGASATTDRTPTTKMTILGSGKVGIGTATPATTLDLNGELRVQGQSVPTSGVGVETYYDGSKGAVQVYDRTNTVYKPMTFGASAFQLNAGVAIGNYGYASVPSNGLIVSGNVGIGTTSPQTTLDVNGAMRLAKNASQPFACSPSADGAIAETSQYTLCLCKGGSTSWVKESDGTTACSW